MIGVAREDGHGPIELLGEHDADELVRPGHRAEGEHERGAVGDRRPRPSGPPITMARSLLPPSRQARSRSAKAALPRALPRSSRATSDARRGATGEERGGLLVLARFGAAGAAFGKFAQREGQAEAPCRPSTARSK